MIDNYTILTRAWLEGSSDFQQRIPKPTQSNIAQVAEFMFDPMNRDLFNQFNNFLINRVGATKIHGRRWENPLGKFKGAKMEYGNTVQEIAFQWVKAHAYRDDVTDLLEIERPQGETAFHSQNRKDRYRISENFNELRSSFLDFYGLNTYLNEIFDIPFNSDNYDEYRIMMELMAFHDYYKGFFKHSLSAYPIDEESGKEFLTALRTYAGSLKFPSSLYNARVTGNIPVFAKPEELVLFYTPQAAASISVNVLAAIFNVDYADIPFRVELVDEFPIPNMVALLTTEDFYVCEDTVYENTTFFNPSNLTTNHYLHHWGVYSTSPFVPAIAFIVGEETTNIPTIKVNVTGLVIEPAQSTVEAGWHVQINSVTSGTINPTDPEVTFENIGVTYEVAGEYNNAPVDLGYDTYIDRYGVLHVGRYVEAGTVIAITGRSTYINPSGKTNDFTANAIVTVAANPTEVDA